MKTFKLYLYPLLSVLIILGSGCKSQQKLIASVKKVEINDAFSKIYKATQAAIAKAKGDDFKIENIDLTLKTVSTTETGGGAKLWVVSGKFTRANSFTQSTTWSFGDNSDKVRGDEEDDNTKKFREYLESVIESSKNIKAIGSFGLKEFQVDVEFVVTNTTEGGVEIEILPVTPSLSISRGKEFTHSISVKFSKKAT